MIDLPSNNVDLKTIHAYDYIKDKNGWIHVVRAFSNKKLCLITNPHYPPKNSNIRKTKGDIPLNIIKPNGTIWSFGDGKLLKISLKDIIEIYPRLTIQSISFPNIPRIVQKLLDYFSKKDCNVYLFGSRRLSLEENYSDWDLLIDSKVSIGALISEFVSLNSSSVRLYNYEECKYRATRYNNENVPLKQLENILLSTTIYLKTSQVEIGIFAVANDDGFIPSELIYDTLPGCHEIIGQIKFGNGESYLMPRRIFLLNNSKKIITILTANWVLAGIEELEGVNIKLSGLKKLSSHSYWFGGDNSKFEIID